MKEYGKMEVVSVQQQMTLVGLENTCTQQQKQLVDVNMELENSTHDLQVQIKKLKGKVITMCQSRGKTFQTSYINNQLREFKELMLDNALFKLQNQALTNNNLKWKEWWQIIQNFEKEQIQDSLELACANVQKHI